MAAHGIEAETGELGSGKARKLDSPEVRTLGAGTGGNPFRSLPLGCISDRICIVSLGSTFNIHGERLTSSRLAGCHDCPSH